MNYFFLYNLTTGVITQPYLGNTDQWTNIPDGHGAKGPFPEEDETAKDAFQNPECYMVVDNTLTPLPNIVEIKAQKEFERNKPHPLSETEIIGQQLVERELEALDLKDQNDILGQQLVDMDLRLLQGGI